MKAFLPEDLDRLAEREREAAVGGFCRKALILARGVNDPSMRTRAAVSPASITGGGGLTQATQAFLSVLTPLSAAADVLERGLQLRWDGAASIALPGATIGGADWVAEGGAFPARQYTVLPGPTLHPAKLGTLTSLTNELIRSSNAETLIREAMIASLAPVLDQKLFGNAAEVVGTNPAGLLATATTVTPSTATVPGDAMVADLAGLVSVVSAVAGKGSILFAANPAQATAIALRTFAAFPYDVLPSTSIPAKTVICIATNVLAVALEDQPQVEAGKEGEIHLETNPQPIVSGSPAVVATPVKSLFQTDSVALKIRWPIAWCTRDSRGVAVASNVLW
jgi:hypothetical protein